MKLAFVCAAAALSCLLPSVRAASDVPAAAAATVLSDANILLKAAEGGDPQALAQLTAKLASVKGNAGIPSHDQFVVFSRAGSAQIAQTKGLTHEARLGLYANAATDMIAQFPAEAGPYQSLFALSEDMPSDTEGLKLAQKLVAMPAAPRGIKAWAQLRIDRSGLLGKPLRFSYYDATRKNHVLSDYRGKTVVLCAWSTLNPASMTALTKLAALASDQVIVLGINLDSSPRQGEAEAAKTWPNLPQAYDLPIERGSLAKQLKLTRLPAVYIVDTKGVLQDVKGLENTEQKLPQKKTKPVATDLKGGSL